MTIKDASLHEVPLIQSLAERIWWPTYSPLLDKGQIEYMLANIYSQASLEKVIRDGSQQFILIYDENGPQGFAAYGPRADEPGVYKLHKLYVLPENHGKGYGKALIDEIKKRLKEKSATHIDLNVYQKNPALKFYERIGFTILREEIIPFGPYTLFDYIMRMKI
jgi:ribosomal protein S18 acetylase RimI-like enzyme